MPSHIENTLTNMPAYYPSANTALSGGSAADASHMTKLCQRDMYLSPDRKKTEVRLNGWGMWQARTVRGNCYPGGESLVEKDRRWEGEWCQEFRPLPSSSKPKVIHLFSKVGEMGLRRHR